MLDVLEQLLDVKCDERSLRKPMSARLCILRVFALRGPCLSFRELFNEYKRGGKGYFRRVLSFLVERGFVKEVGGGMYCLTVKGLSIAQRDPPCPTLFLAGADNALKVALNLDFRPLNWLLSAGRYWRGGRFVYSSDFRLARSLGGLLFLDSGAQQFYSKFRGSGYPYTARQYLDFALTVRADLIATLDLPLDILTSRGLSVEEGIRRTVELGVEVVALAESLGVQGKVVPVLQGYSDPSQWLESVDLYRQHGITPQKFKVWGVGSLCMARNSRLVEGVIRAVRRVLGGEARIHVFGISMNSLRKVYDIIDSYDTSAWVYWAKMDGAVLVWSSRKRAFIHLRSRDNHRYHTEDLMELNLKNILEMHRNLCQLKHNAPTILTFTR
jgi:hypothetical protein